MKKIIKASLLTLLASVLIQKSYSQAPSISYTGNTALTAGAIFTISPINSGGAVPATIYGQVTTFAGSLYQSSGYSNGTGTNNVLFNQPKRLAMDASGNIYLSDAGNNVIRRITSAGLVTTFAGSPTGASGYKDTTVAAAALFNNPGGMAVDGSGNVFVSDYNNNAIRKITPAGAVSTFYTQSGMGPSGLCFDSSGNLIVTAQTLRAILKISPAGVATTIAGGSWGYTNGTGTAAQFENPADARLDPSGNIIVADYLNNAIRKISPAGQVTTLAGSTVSGNTGSVVDGIGTAARFDNPTGVAITQGGVIYVAELASEDIRRIMPDGTVTLIAGSPHVNGNTDAVGTAASFNNPLSIYVDNTGTGYVVDMYASVRKLVLTGYTLKGTLPAGLSFNATTGTISGTPTGTITTVTDTITAYNATGFSTAMLTFTPGVPPLPAPNITYTASTTLTAGTAFTISPSNSGGAIPATTYGQVATFAGSLTQSSGYTNATGTNALFNQPERMVKDASGNIYLSDNGNNAIRKITPGGQVTTFAGSLTGASGYKDTTAATSALFNGPGGVAIDGSGNLFVSDYNNNAIRKITPAGAVSTFYTQSGMGPSGLCFDGSGNLIVTAQTLRAILKISPAGVATTIAGGSWGYTNGTGTAAQFENPADAQLDPSGNIIVADFLNNAIRKITPAGVVTTLAGSTASGNTGAVVDGVGTAARFNNPTGVAITQGGVIYVAELASEDIRRIMPDGTVTLIAGSHANGNTDGVGTAASFNNPFSIYVDNTGTGYVVDVWASVRKVVLTGYTLKGTLPAGLTFDPATGIINGTPTGTITAVTDTITAFNASGYSTAMVTFTPGGPSVIPTPNTNYTVTYLPRLPITDTSALYNQPVINENQTIQYFDGLGRAMQSVQAQASPSQKDFIMPYAYDNMGRAVKAYLPYSDQSTSASTSGSFRTTAFTDAVNFYNPSSPGATKIPTDVAPYAQTVYEASPLERVNEQGGIGSTFQPGTGHTVTSGYHVNGYADNINYYAISSGVPVTISSFNPQVLTKAIVTDQNGHRQALWKDLQGKTITWSQLDASTPYYSTDYIYNDLDELINIVPPAGKKQLASGGSPLLTQTLASQSYIFHYDSIGRVIEKKVPGKGWIYIIYNRSNRPVLTQDSNMRVKNQWLYVKYDAEGRMIQTGVYTNTTVTSRNAVQNLCDSSFPVTWETWQPGVGYTNNAFPQQSAIPATSPLVIYTLYYYDDYSFSEVANRPFQTNIFNTSPTLRTTGLLTGTSVYVLGTTNQRLVTVNYYDNQNRLIQQVSDNHLGQVDVINTQYNFIGQAIGSQRTIMPIAGSPLIVKDSYVYDQVGRLMDTYESLNGSAEIDISHNVYNEIDQKVSEGLHSINYKGPGSTGYTFAQTQEFRYSIRGELTNINNGTLTNDGVTQSDSTALFGESITYSEASSLGAAPQYNGNISGITWRNKIEKTGLPGVSTGGQGYAFHYDNVSRLTQSDYYTQSGSTFSLNTAGALMEKIGGYDEMGNIDTLLRKDKSGNLLNKLTYTYQSSGNQLVSISDAGSQNISGTFTYDGNGNMISDSHKGITISYNYLDLPDTVKQGNSKLVFTYDAAGNKLYKQLITSGNVVSQRHYIEDAELTATSSVSADGQVESIAMDEGRIVNTGGGNYQWEYYLQDHLYTNRVTFRPNSDGTLNLSSVQNYYPFGGDMGDATMNYSATPHNYNKYEGNELQPELNLNTYDFGARHYDPVLARWTAIDPLAEQSEELSPYNYVENNPMNLMDPDVMQPGNGCVGCNWGTNVQNAGGSSLGAGGIFGGAGANFAAQFSSALDALSFKRVTTQSGFNKVQGNVLHPTFTPSSQATLSQWKPSSYDNWKNAGFFGKFTYGIADDAYVSTRAIFWPWGDQTHLNGWDAPAADKQSAFGNTTALLIPMGRGATVGKVVLENVAERGAIQVVKQTGFESLTYAGKYGFGEYGALSKLTRGLGLEVHHLIEKRFAAILGQQASKMTSIVLTEAEHQAFTNAWRAQIGYLGSKAALTTGTVTKLQIENAARVVYKDYPEILRALGLF